MKTGFLLASMLGVVFAVVGAPASTAAPPRRPASPTSSSSWRTIRVGEVGCYGADHYKTPNIDALAKSGIRYTHAYTVPLCGPSRAVILTGRTPSARAP